MRRTFDATLSFVREKKAVLFRRQRFCDNSTFYRDSQSGVSTWCHFNLVKIWANLGIKIERMVWGFDGKIHKKTIRVLFFYVNLNAVHLYKIK